MGASLEREPEAVHLGQERRPDPRTARTTNPTNQRRGTLAFRGPFGWCLLRCRGFGRRCLLGRRGGGACCPRRGLPHGGRLRRLSPGCGVTGRGGVVRR